MKFVLFSILYYLFLLYRLKILLTTNLIKNKPRNRHLENFQSTSANRALMKDNNGIFASNGIISSKEDDINNLIKVS